MKLNLRLYMISCLWIVSNTAGYGQDTSLTVHEWGTFTARYTGFGIPYTDMNKRAEEHLPPFVYSIDFSRPLYGYAIDVKGYAGDLDGVPMKLINTSVKMETPVLYFYSPFVINNLDVKVRFKQGSISQYYPMPYAQEDSNYIKGRVNDCSDVPLLDFSKYDGFANWKINILERGKMHKPTYRDDSVPHIWLAPRQTAANIIECGGQREHYIFYRGLGGFENPLVPSYTNKGNLLLKNRLSDDIPFLMVYEKDAAGKVFIWTVQKMKSLEELSVQRSRLEVSAQDWRNKYRPMFVNALVHEGLYSDEANAMLNTWDSSYFGQAGVRIFWVVPRSFTDKILPISFSARVNHLERVMVGRTEIEAFNNDMSGLYPVDVAKGQERSYSIYPNPASDALYISYNENVQETIELKMRDLQGRLITTCNVLLAPYTGNLLPLDLGVMPRGIYFITIKDSDARENTYKISIQ